MILVDMFKCSCYNLWQLFLSTELFLYVVQKSNIDATVREKFKDWTLNGKNVLKVFPWSLEGTGGGGL